MGKKRRGWFDRTRGTAPPVLRSEDAGVFEEASPASEGGEDPPGSDAPLLPGAATSDHPVDAGDHPAAPDPKPVDEQIPSTVPVLAQCQCAGRLPQIHTVREVIGRSNFKPTQIVITYRCPRCKVIVPLTAEQLRISPN